LAGRVPDGHGPTGQTDSSRGNPQILDDPYARALPGAWAAALALRSGDHRPRLGSGRPACAAVLRDCLMVTRAVVCEPAECHLGLWVEDPRSNSTRRGAHRSGCVSRSHGYSHRLSVSQRLRCGVILGRRDRFVLCEGSRGKEATLVTKRQNQQRPRQLWVEVGEPDADQAFAIPVQPKRARCLPASVRVRELAHHPISGRVARRLRALTGGRPQGGS
jgi:hypothetical protein